MRPIRDNDSPGALALGQDARDERRAGPRESARRRSPLQHDPSIEVVDMAMLVQVARAIEDEAVRRYEMLAELMDSRGEPATASAFRVMLEEERRHVAAVERWAAALPERGAATSHFEWHLPADLSSSWDDVSGSALLTPYRAFALAVENEERAFSFYAYLAAHAETDGIRAEAEKLGAEELRHAALMRRWRRRAFHAGHHATRAGPAAIETSEALRAVLAQHQHAIAATHGAIALRLRGAGDPDSAALLEGSLDAAEPPGAATAGLRANARHEESTTAPGDDDPRHLLIDAQKPLEALADLLESIMATAEGDLFSCAADAMDDVVRRIAQVSLRIGSLREP